MCSNVFVYGEDKIRVKDSQLVKVLLVAAKKSFYNKMGMGRHSHTAPMDSPHRGNLHIGNDNALPETA